MDSKFYAKPAIERKPMKNANKEKLINKFKGMRMLKQLEILEVLRQAGFISAAEKILACDNAKDRTKLFAKAIKFNTNYNEQ